MAGTSVPPTAAADEGEITKGRITKARARAFRARWEAVNAAEVDELLVTSMAHKTRQLASLMASVAKPGWSEALTEEETEVRNR